MLDSALPKAGIGFLQKADLLLGEVDILAVLLFFEPQEPFIACHEVFFYPDVADRAGAYEDAL